MSVRPHRSKRRQPSRNCAVRAVRAACERLEPRALLSLTAAGIEFRLNTFTTNSQSLPAVAMDGDGEFVVAWQSGGSQDGSGSGIVARRYNHNNLDFPFTELAVNTFTTGNQTNPAVAMDAEDEFVVVWESAGQDGSGLGIYAQRYGRVGARRGHEFRVNEMTAFDQGGPDVASAATGDFVVVWHNAGTGSAGYDIVARLYDLHGIPRGAEFVVNSFTTDTQLFPTVAMDADGDFVVAWNSYGQDGSANGIYAQRFDKTGAAQGGEFRVNQFTTADQDFPSVAMDHSGDFVIAWESAGQDGAGDGVYAQRYSAAGAAQGGEFRVNVTTSSHQGNPTVASDADGEFVVAWAGVVGGNNDSFLREYDAAGAPQTTELRANTFTSFNQSFPVVAGEHEGDVIVAWESDGQDGSSHGVYAQRFDQGPDDAGPVASDVNSSFERFIPGVRLARRILQLSIEFSEDLSQAGGATGPNSVLNRANYAVTRNGVDYTPGMGVSYTTTTNVYRVFIAWNQYLFDGDYVVTVRDALRDLAGNALDGDRDGTPGGDFTFTFTVQSPVKLDPEFRVNATTAGDQTDAAVATDDAGNFVVAWAGPDGGGGSPETGIFARRFNADGTPIGAEFRVNTFIAGMQRLPTIAMDADGDFVVAWQSYAQDGSGYGVYAQRYNASGVPQGTEFRVNQHTTNLQADPSVAMTGDGTFVVAWDSLFQDGSGFGVVARRFAPSGAPLGNEFIVNTDLLNTQQDPAVAVDFDGDFVVAWSGDSDSSVASDIHVQRYNRDGARVGNAFIVNTFVTGEQFSPDVAMTDNGDFTVVWTSRDQDGSDDGVYFRRFNAAGVAGNGFDSRANTFTTGRQWFPTVALDGDGDFVITWASDPQDGSGFGVYGIFAETFADETKVSTFRPGDQHYPAVAMDGDGDFVVAWHSAGQDGSGNGIYAQRFAHAPPRVLASSFHFLTAPHTLSFTFNQNVQSIAYRFALRLQNLTTGFSFGLIENASYDTDSDTATWSMAGHPNIPGGVLPDGRYRATLAKEFLVTPGGATMAEDHVFEFFFLNGDANRDARVNLEDFNILAANFGQSNRNFSQGDFTYDGIVNLNDFNVLASRFGQTVAPASQPAGPGDGDDDNDADDETDLLA